MKKTLAAVLAVTLVIAGAEAGLVAWLLSRDDGGPDRPQISAFTAGQLVRVGPSLYCNVLDLNDCDDAHDEGVLHTNPRDPVQLSVPQAIARAPWRLVLVYRDPRDTTIRVFRPDTRLAVTVPAVDANRGPLMQLVVQLMTLVQDQNGEVFEMPHAEWSVQTVQK
ncbi:DUF2771 domain-containing protein [Mycolicibacterium palauense]|uniref:DUF2771 domain-containing protein n=1 Tax=Mycolicibacterium palauense TaxID=2034511 RepID=UPI000BFEEBEF|nr:DUF2771 domain-containing protein [Mycolicibacterium palauense]